MNILIISTLYPEPSDMGVVQDTSAVHYFAKKWAEEGNKVVVLHPYRNPITNIKKYFQLKAKGILENNIDGVTVIFGAIQLLVPHNYVPFKYQQIALAKKLKQYLSSKMPDFKPDVISVHFPMTNYYLCKGFIDGNQKTACVLHNSDISLLRKMKPEKKRFIIEELKKTYRNIATRSSIIHEQAKALGICDVSSPVILSGISENLIADDEYISKKDYSTLKDNMKIVYAGKLVKRKRVDLILKAISLLNESTTIHLTVIGDGPEKDELINLTKKLEISDFVEFCGAVDRKRVVDIMRQSDVFAMISKNETFGLVYLEAMAQGLITIGSSGEGIDGTIINGVNGFLVSPDNDSELCECIKTIHNLSNTELSEISLNAYQTAVEMTDSKMARKYLDFVKS